MSANLHKSNTSQACLLLVLPNNTPGIELKLKSALKLARESLQDFPLR